MRLKLILIVGLVIIATAVLSQGESQEAEAPAEGEAAIDEEKTLYALGLAMAQNLNAFSLTPEELATVTDGLRDGVLGNEPKIDFAAYRGKIQTLAMQRRQAAVAVEKQASMTYLEEAAATEGAQKTESGLIYTELVAGTGEQPTAKDRVKVHYHGTLRDGTVFDSSVERGSPAEFGLGQVVKCWTEGVQMMKVGGKAKLVCPADIAYGDRGRPPLIAGGAALTFEVELLEIVKPETPAE